LSADTGAGTNAAHYLAAFKEVSSMKKLKVQRSLIRVLSNNRLGRAVGGVPAAPGENTRHFSELVPQQCIRYVTEANCPSQGCM
jgi:hypothetical protein